MKILISGGIGGSNVGDSLHRAALELGHQSTILDSKIALQGPRFWRAFQWRYCDRRPCNLTRYNQQLKSELANHQFDVMICTGVAPVTQSTLAFAQHRKVRCVNYSTDDPWNRTHFSRRFVRTIPSYDAIYTPRTLNVEDFKNAGARCVSILDFGFDPKLAFPMAIPKALDFDLLFVGGGDRDRSDLIRRLIRAGIKLRIIGSFWDSDLSPVVVGQLEPLEVCRLTNEAKINLIIPRASNRDGHTMRSYEAAACGAAIIAESTPDHHRIYGDCALYFRSSNDLLSSIGAALRNNGLLCQLGNRLRERIVGLNATYVDRLKSILQQD